MHEEAEEVAEQLSEEELKKQKKQGAKDAKAEAKAANKNAFSKKEQRALVKADKKAAGGGRFSKAAPSWKPVFFTGLGNELLKGNKSCVKTITRTPTTENLHERAARMFLCDLMLMSMVFTPVAKMMNSKEYKKEPDKAARELMIVHALNKGTGNQPPALFAAYDTPMDAFLEFERRYESAQWWMRKGSGMTPNAPNPKPKSLTHFCKKKNEMRGKGIMVMMKVGADKAIMKSCLAAFAAYDQTKMFTNKDDKSSTIWGNIEAPLMDATLNEMAGDYMKDQAKGAIEGEMKNALGGDDGGAKDELIQMGMEQLGLADMIEGLEGMIDMIAEGAYDAVSGLMGDVFSLVADVV